MESLALLTSNFAYRSFTEFAVERSVIPSPPHSTILPKSLIYHVTCCIIAAQFLLVHMSLSLKYVQIYPKRHPSLVYRETLWAGTFA